MYAAEIDQSKRLLVISAFQGKNGIQIIPPGRKLHVVFSMTPQLASCD
jgi:hypothetical protein